MVDEHDGAHERVGSLVGALVVGVLEEIQAANHWVGHSHVELLGGLVVSRLLMLLHVVVDGFGLCDDIFQV